MTPQMAVNAGIILYRQVAACTCRDDLQRLTIFYFGFLICCYYPPPFSYISFLNIVWQVSGNAWLVSKGTAGGVLHSKGLVSC